MVFVNMRLRPAFGGKRDEPKKQHFRTDRVGADSRSVDGSLFALVARGMPSRRWQIRATLGAFWLVSSKALDAAVARSLKRLTASYC